LSELSRDYACDGNEESGHHAEYKPLDQITFSYAVQALHSFKRKNAFLLLKQEVLVVGIENLVQPEAPEKVGK
jgi:hypothetical protein